MPKKKQIGDEPGKIIIRSDHHLSPVAKVTVLAHSLETVAHNLDELSQLCEKLGESALGREAQVIREAFLQRRHAFLVLSRQAGKSQLLEGTKPYGSKKIKEKGKRRISS